jgi:mono/diheme cytochrome c family protein
MKDLTSYLKTGFSSRAVAFGPMIQVVANSTSHLTDEDIAAVAEYLMNLPAVASGAGPSPSPQQMKQGEVLYTANCGSCHQPNGLGSAKTAPPLSGSAIVLAANPASLINAILYSPEVSDTLHGGVSRPPMPAFEAKLDDDDIALVATYVRNSWSNKAGSVTLLQVAAQR